MKPKKIMIACLGATLLAFCIALAGCNNAPSSGPTRTVTDINGTVYTIPQSVTKVAPTTGTLTQITEMISNGNSKVVATMTSQISDQLKTIVSSYIESNPKGYDTGSIEEVIESGAQVVYGPSSLYSNEQKQQLKDAGITFIPMDNPNNVEDICNTTLLIGQILGDEEYSTAKNFVSYWQENISDAESRTANLKESKKPTVLGLAYDNGTWTTESDDSMVGAYIEAAGGKNVSAGYSAKSAGNQNDGIAVDEKQIVKWNPDYIITYSATATGQVNADKALAGVTAVRKGQVYTCPKGLYSWTADSGEGSLMAPWLGTVINPSLFHNVDMVDMVRSFFSQYYRYALTEDDANQILAGTF